LIEGFLHPGLAWGALLAAVPLVIHLLNRRRHRPLAFGAMRFVALAHKRTRRRARLEDLLLLLLRTGAVVLLALALARPLTRADGVLGPLTEARRNLALIVDASASTGQRLGVQTAFERILARARERVADLDGDRGDRVLLVWGDDQPRLLSWRGPEEALALLADGQIPSDGSLELGTALGVVEEALASELFLEDGAGLELVLLCDGQRGLFEAGLEGADEPTDGPAEAASAAAESGSEPAPAARQRPALLKALDRLAERGLKLAVEDLAAGGSGENTTLAELALVQPPRGPGLPMEFTARVEAQASGPRPGARLALSGTAPGRRCVAWTCRPRALRRRPFRCPSTSPACTWWRPAWRPMGCRSTTAAPWSSRCRGRCASWVSTGLPTANGSRTTSSASSARC
jgi:hypothetical protein